MRSEPSPRRRRRFRLPRARWLIAIGLGIPVLLLMFGWLYANAKFNEIDKVEVSSVLSPAGGGGTNYLIVGSDSREVVFGPDGVPETEPGGQRSDTMLVLRIERGRSLMMSIPRDLFVTHAGSGEEGRINGAYNGGPANLIQTVQQNLRIPVHRYIEVDFVTFAGLVDALGGITINFPNPAFDVESGLYQDVAGDVELNGEQALAYVRSRNYTEVINGEEVVDPTGDLGRVVRQQAFLRTVLSDAGSSRNPFTLMDIAGSVTDGLRVDDGMSLWTAIRFAWNMGRLDPEPVVLPTFGFRTSAGAAVLGLDEDLAPTALEEMR